MVTPSDVATKRPKADGSGSTWMTSAFSPLQRGENARRGQAVERDADGDQQIARAPNRYSSARPSPNRPSTPSDSGCVSGTMPRPFGVVADGSFACSQNAMSSS